MITQCSKIGQKSAISKVQKHIFCYFKNGKKKSIFAPEKSLKLTKNAFLVPGKSGFFWLKLQFFPPFSCDGHEPRECHFFTEHKDNTTTTNNNIHSEKPNILWLRRIPCPSDYTCSEEPYFGPILKWNDSQSP